MAEKTPELSGEASISRQQRLLNYVYTKLSTPSLTELGNTNLRCQISPLCHLFQPDVICQRFSYNINLIPSWELIQAAENIELEVVVPSLCVAKQLDI